MEGPIHISAEQPVMVCIFLVNKTNRRTELRLYQEQDGTNAILLLVANGHQDCIKCTNADVRLRTPDDGRKGCPKHVES
jgi:hypothetical protein